MTTQNVASDYRIFVLGKGASSFSVTPEDAQKIAEILRSDGGVHIVYAYRLEGEAEERHKQQLQHSVESLTEFLRPFHSDFTVQSSFWVGRPGWYKSHIHVILESDIIRFTEAPWHPNNCPGGKEHPRLLEMVNRGRPFTAVYIFDDQPNHREDGTAGLFLALRDLVEGVKNMTVIRRDWPVELFKGKCRVDIRIEPQAVVASPSAIGPAPTCDQCGHITIRSGDIFKCRNCGNEMEAK